MMDTLRNYNSFQLIAMVSYCLFFCSFIRLFTVSGCMPVELLSGVADSIVLACLILTFVCRPVMYFTSTILASAG